MKLLQTLLFSSLILLSCVNFSFANNGILIGLHYNNSNFRQTELGIDANRNKELTTNTGEIVYSTSDNTPSAGAATLYTWGWNNGSGSKAWAINLTSTGFENLAISFYQKSRAQLVGVWEYGPRDFKLQYSTNGSSWSDVSGASYALTTTWQEFEYTLPEECENQTTVYLRWIMTSNTSINGGAIATGGLSDFADFYIYADEIPLPITDISLSNTTISSGQPSGTTVGTLSVTDANIWDTHTYSLIAGTGDTHNSSFSIDGNALKTSAILTPGNYSIRVKADDGTYSREENYTIIVSTYPIVTVGDPAWNSDTWITRVQFGTIDKSSGMSGENNALGYSDFTSEITDAEQGETIGLTITANVVTSYTENIRVYFDWNQDYDLTDDGEHFDLLTGSSATGELSPTLSISIPADAAEGNTLMRVVVDNGNALALGVADYGEVEDYTINIGGALPVELITFTASVSNEKVTLNWNTATEVNNYGFEIERYAQSADRKGWETLGFIEGAGNSNSPKEYSFTDNTTAASTPLSYRLKQIDLDGSFKYSNEIEVNVENLPTEFALEQNYPNPFNPVTTIKYAIPTPPTSSPLVKGRTEVGFVTLKVFNLLGQEVATLVNTQQPAGNYEVKFDASNLSSGIYLYKLQAGDFSSVKKLILMK